MAAAESQADDLVTQKMLTANLRTQLDHVMTEDRARVDGRIEELEAELALERRKREAAEEDEQMSLSPRRARCSKRASAASDSGFESDVDSILSRSDTRCTVVNLTAEEAEDENADCDGCYAAVGAETKTPTPLREAWSHEAGSSASKPGVWGFIKGLQQHHGHGGRYGGDLEGMRMENRYLRERVRTMEKAVEGALEAVAGRGIGI